MFSVIKPAAQPLLETIARPFSKVDPNILTLVGMVSPILFFIFTVNGWYWGALLALPLSIFDAIDGTVARMANKVTAFGGFFDSSLDRIADTLFIAAFAVAGLARYEIVLLVVFLSLLISYLRSRAELAANNAFKLNIGIIERSERLLFVLVALLAAIFIPTGRVYGFNSVEIVLLVLCLLSAVTVVQRFIGAYSRLRQQ